MISTPLSRYCWPHAQPLRSGFGAGKPADGARVDAARCRSSGANTGSLSKNTSILLVEPVRERVLVVHRELAAQQPGSEIFLARQRDSPPSTR